MGVELDFRHLRLPRRRFEISTGTRRATDVFIVMLRSGELTGIGAGTPSTSTLDDPTKCSAVLSSVSQRSSDIGDAAWDRIAYELRDTSPSAAAALDIAVWDLRGKQDGQSVSHLLGCPPRSIRTDATVDLRPPIEAGKLAERLLREGYETIKVKIGRSISDDLARVTAVREAIGDDICLIVDANGGYDADSAILFWEKASRLGLKLLEQPIPADDIAELRKLRTLIDIPICADESVRDERCLEQHIEEDAIDAVNIKLMKCGGLTPAVEMDEMARNAGLEVMIGCMGDIGLSIAAAAHLANCKSPEFVDLDSHLSIEPICDGPEVDNGHLILRDLPGLGVSLSENIDRWFLPNRCESTGNH